MSERLILELYERIAILEDKVAIIEKSQQPVDFIGTGKVKSPKEIKGRYRYLADYLSASDKDIEDLTFAEIEQIIQSELPVSARKHRALWANSESHSIALAWLTVGFITTAVDMDQEKIRFERRKL